MFQSCTVLCAHRTSHRVFADRQGSRGPLMLLCATTNREEVGRQPTMLQHWLPLSLLWWQLFQWFHADAGGLPRSDPSHNPAKPSSPLALYRWTSQSHRNLGIWATTVHIHIKSDTVLGHDGSHEKFRASMHALHVHCCGIP